MHNDIPKLGALLERDLAEKGWTQRDLVAKLSQGSGAVVKEQALSNWKQAERVPKKWIAKLVEVLGPESSIAKVATFTAPAVPYSVRKAPSGETLFVIPSRNVEYLPTGEVFKRPSRLDIVGRRGQGQQGSMIPLFNRSEMTPVGDQTFDTFLPEELREKCQVAVRISGRRYYYDYLSDAIAVEVKPVRPRRDPSIHSTMSRVSVVNARSALLRLQLIRALDPEFERQYYLVIEGSDLEDEQKRIEMLEAEGQLVGIKVHTSAGPERTAKLIHTLENAAKASEMEEEDEEF